MISLITGGAGFIGSHLAQALCRRGEQVRVLDNLLTGSLRNFGWADSNDKLEFIRGSVTDTSLMKHAIQDCTNVFHLAAEPSVQISIAHPFETHDINLNATLNLLILSRDLRLKRFVFASSSAIYGDAGEGPIHELRPPAPLSPYGLHKFAGETYARMFHSLYGLPTVSLRYFNVFGPRQTFSSPYSGVIARFCTNLLNGVPVKLFGDGLQSRDFVFVDNVVGAMLSAIDSPEDQVAGRSFNIGTGQAVNLLALNQLLQTLTGNMIAPDNHSPRQGDIRFSQADITLARTHLAYKPFVGLEKGLAKTLDYYRSMSGNISN